MDQKVTFGLIVGTRGIFNGALATSGRKQLCAVLDTLGYKYVIMPLKETPTGAVETVEDAKKCAAFFQKHRGTIKGIIVTLPNFGNELGIVNALKLAEMNVPVLVHAFDDDNDKVGLDQRRDAFCGKLSVCNNLWQYGIPFSLTTNHTCRVDSKEFAADLHKFAGVSKVVYGMRHGRIGSIGARPTAFQTMRISEKLLQRTGLSVVTLDLSEIIFAALKTGDKDQAVVKKLDDIRAYGAIPAAIPVENVVKSAKLSVALERWMNENDIDAAGIQCWTSIQKNYGCATCLPMSMMGDRLLPCACEVDIGGVVGMFALTLASGNASALLDWNTNYAEERNKCVNTHCSNYPNSFVNAKIEISNLDILGKDLGYDNCFGAIKGKVAAGPMTYFRVSTDDFQGRIRSYLGEGDFTKDPYGMAGGIAVCNIPDLQGLMRHLCKNGYEHHVAMVRSHCADIIQEAAETYLGWELYRHGAK